MLLCGIINELEREIVADGNYRNLTYFFCQATDSRPGPACRPGRISNRPTRRGGTRPSNASGGPGAARRARPQMAPSSLGRTASLLQLTSWLRGSRRISYCGASSPPRSNGVVRNKHNYQPTSEPPSTKLRNSLPCWEFQWQMRYRYWPTIAKAIYHRLSPQLPTGRGLRQLRTSRRLWQ